MTVQLCIAHIVSKASDFVDDSKLLFCCHFRTNFKDCILSFDGVALMCNTTQWSSNIWRSLASICSFVRLGDANGSCSRLATRPLAVANRHDIFGIVVRNRLALPPVTRTAALRADDEDDDATLDRLGPGFFLLYLKRTLACRSSSSSRSSYGLRYEEQDYVEARTEEWRK